MKRVNNLFDKITDIDNIKLAHKNASRGKKRYKEVIMVNKDIDLYCSMLERNLKDFSYSTSPYEVEMRNDRGKLREIFKLPYYPDRIVHHAIMQVLEPIWLSILIDSTYQSIKGRGIHKCKKNIEKTLRKSIGTELYCLKIDITKFYPSVDNEVLKEIIRYKIKCKNTLRLLDGIIDSSKGVPIGNYLSQYLGNLYLAYFDHYCKEELKLVNYYRYCDDIVIIHKDKGYLHESFKLMEEYLNNKLKLKVKTDWQVFPINKRPIDFIGYVFYPTYTLLRKSIKNRFVKYDKDKSISGYYGWIKHCDGHNLLNKHTKEIVNDNLQQ